MGTNGSAEAQSGGSRRLIGGAIVLAFAAIAAWAWLVPDSPGLLEQTLALQERLLAGTLSGADRKAAIRAVTRNVDHMDRATIKKVHEAFNAQWRKLQTEAMDRYFAADEKERIAVLDMDIPAFVAAADIWLAINPLATGPPRRLPPKPTKTSPKKPVSPEVQQFESYRNALVKRSAAKGLQVPDWLLRPQPRSKPRLQQQTFVPVVSPVPGPPFDV
jgi:hypothetical protein